MISSVIITGIIGDMVGDKRIILTDNPDVLHNDNVLSKIPAVYWTRMEPNVLTKCKKGTFCVTKGHLECNETDGIYYVVESIQLADLVSI